MGPSPFRTVSKNGLAWLACQRFRRLPWLVHAFSTRLGGVSAAPSAGLNLGFTQSDQRPRVEENRRRFLTQLGAEGFTLAHLRQIHSSHVYQVARGPGGKLEYRPCGVPAPELSMRTPLAGDALLTQQPGILLSVRSADCLLVLLVDPELRAVGAAHAGWRGALARVIEKTVGEMRRIFGSRPERLFAALGPSIRACCYEVGEEVVDAFHGCFRQADRFFRYGPRTGSSTDLFSTSAGLQQTQDRGPAFLEAPPLGQAPRLDMAPHLDLVAVARAQLEEAGLSAPHISVADFCTACRTDLFFSNRKEGARTGRMMAVMGVRG